jgi:hypothetical protein
MAEQGCEKVQELFPLLVNGSIVPDDRAQVEEHLRSCQICQSIYDQERPMFLLACQKHNVHSALADHPEIDSLRQFVEDAGNMSSEQADEIKTHLADCELCRDVESRLRNLPAEAASLLNEKSAPFLTNLDQSNTELAHIDPQSKDFLRNPLVGYLVAAAAIIIVILDLAFSPFVGTRPEPAAIVEIALPAQTRATAAPLVYTTPTAQSYLNLTVPIRPEEAHIYNLALTRLPAGKLIESRSDVRSFDPIGRTQLTVLADTGTYALTISDILANDTVKLEYRFDVQLLD